MEAFQKSKQSWSKCTQLRITHGKIATIILLIYSFIHSLNQFVLNSYFKADIVLCLGNKYMTKA